MPSKKHETLGVATIQHYVTPQDHAEEKKRSIGQILSVIIWRVSSLDMQSLYPISQNSTNVTSQKPSFLCEEVR